MWGVGSSHHIKAGLTERTKKNPLYSFFVYYEAVCFDDLFLRMSQEQNKMNLSFVQNLTIVT